MSKLQFEELYEMDESTGCWEWTGTKTTGGYGLFRCLRQDMPAHRFSWWMYHGPIPDGIYVLHHCSNPGCVNPEHLFLGTAKDRTRNMGKKGQGKHLKGADHNNAKLSKDDVDEIKKLVEAGYTGASIARQFNISASVISKIKTGKHWACQT